MSKKPSRRFRAAPGATVILPRSVMTGPGVTNVTIKGRDVAGRGEGDVDEFELEHDQVDRFIRQRVRSGDLIELDPAPSGSGVRIAEGSGPRGTPLDLEADPDPLPPPTKRR